MTTDMRQMAQDYADRSSITWQNGERRDWRYYGAHEIMRFMLAACERLDALEERLDELEATTEMVELLGRKCREVDELEKELIQAREGMYYGELGF